MKTRFSSRLMDKGVGEEGEGEMNGESGMDAHTLTYVNREPVGDSLNSNWGPGVGGKFNKEGSYVHLWLIHVDV